MDEFGVVGIKLTGTLRDADFQSIAPDYEKLLTRLAPVRLLADWEDFEGWDDEATAQIFHFRTSQRSKIERVAVLGGDRHKLEVKKLAQGLGNIPVRLYPVDERDETLSWLIG
jgi:hypothetical protein